MVHNLIKLDHEDNWIAVVGVRLWLRLGLQFCVIGCFLFIFGDPYFLLVCEVKISSRVNPFYFSRPVG